MSAQGSITTPLPMTESLPDLTIPDGSSDNLYVTPSMTRVWPALWPPWKRTTISARSDSQSTILPLPSSPHWAPTTATLPMLVLRGSALSAGPDQSAHRDYISGRLSRVCNTAVAPAAEWRLDYLSTHTSSMS